MTVVTMDQRHFRAVLGHYPTGVVIVTGMARDNDVDCGDDFEGGPAGMVIGSFMSVSLDPPLVAFLPRKDSRTFARLRTAPALCVNVLAAEQEPVCQQLGAGGRPGDLGDLSWRPSPVGAPILDGVVAWIDCQPDQVIDGGDHYIVLCRVTGLSAESAGPPLLFFQGGYGRFAR
jgi:flavin reductase (DIM6/NTAB) family NADH-FMN oxidoreductase RutF